MINGSELLGDFIQKDSMPEYRLLDTIIIYINIRDKSPAVRITRVFIKISFSSPVEKENSLITVSNNLSHQNQKIKV